MHALDNQQRARETYNTHMTPPSVLVMCSVILELFQIQISHISVYFILCVTNKSHSTINQCVFTRTMRKQFAIKLSFRRNLQIDESLKILLQQLSIEDSSKAYYDSNILSAGYS